MLRVSLRPLLPLQCCIGFARSGGGEGGGSAQTFVGRLAMRSYFARHTERLSVRDEDLRALWGEDKIAVHYPGDTERAPDLRSLEPEDYSGTGKTAIRYLRDLEENGGYVWAESRISPGVAKVGRVQAGTPIKLDGALWEVDGVRDGRKSGDEAVLKTLRLEEGSVRLVGRTEQVGLRAGRPRQGTIVRWNCGARLADLVEGRDPKEEWPNLSTEQQEAACAEFLKWQHERGDLPRLRYLLLPVGRTLKDVDIYGLAEDGRKVFAQVTYHSRRRKESDEKVEKLRAYGELGAHLVFFGKGTGPAAEEGIPFVSVEGAVMTWVRNQPPEYRASLFRG